MSNLLLLKLARTCHRVVLLLLNILAEQSNLNFSFSLVFPFPPSLTALMQISLLFFLSFLLFPSHCFYSSERSILIFCHCLLYIAQQSLT